MRVISSNSGQHIRSSSDPTILIDLDPDPTQRYPAGAYPRSAFEAEYTFLGVPIPDAYVMNSAGIVAAAVEGFIRAASHAHDWVVLSDHLGHVATCFICDTTTVSRPHVVTPERMEWREHVHTSR